MKQIAVSAPTRTILAAFYSDRGNEISLAGRILTMADDGVLRAIRTVISYGKPDHALDEILRDVNRLRDGLNSGSVLLVKG